MTPASLNILAPSLPLSDHQQEDKNHLFISPTNNKDPSSPVSSPTSCIFDESHTGDIRKQRHDQELDSSVVCGPKYKKDKEEISRSSNHKSSGKWMGSEMRLMQKVNLSNSPDSSSNITTSHKASSYKYNNGNSINRACADCNTTSTPLWRSGPNGPKSLCNACGIRQRKARKAMEEAASWTKARIVDNKEKNYQLKKKWKGNIGGRSQGKREFGFKDFELTLKRNSIFQKQVFPRDEVVEGALLLMDLSCGFIPF